MTPRRPRRASLHRKSVQNVSASEAPIALDVDDFAAGFEVDSAGVVAGKSYG